MVSEKACQTSSTTLFHNYSYVCCFSVGLRAVLSFRGRLKYVLIANRAPTRCRPGRGAASAQREPTRRTPVVASHRRRTTIRCRRRVVEGMRTGTALRRRWDGADIDSAAAQHRTCGCGCGRDDDACVRIRDARGAPRSFLPPSLLLLLPLLSPPSSSPIVRIVIFTSPPLGRGGGRVPPRQTIFLSS